MRMISRAASRAKSVQASRRVARGRGGAWTLLGGGDLIAHSPMANRLLGVISALPEEFAHLSDQLGPTRSEIGGLALLARPDRRPRGGVRRIGRGQGQCRRRHLAAARPLRLPRADAVRRGGRPRSGAGRRRRRDRHQPHPARLRHRRRRTASAPSSPAAGRRWAQDWTPGYPVAEPLVARLQRGARGPGAGAAAGGRRRRPAHARHPFRRAS